MQKSISDLIFYHHTINCDFDINEFREDEKLILNFYNSILFSEKIKDNLFECKVYIYYVCELCEHNGKMIDQTLPFFAYMKFIINKNSNNFELLTDKEKQKIMKEKSFQIRNELFDNLIIEPTEIKISSYLDTVNQKNQINPKNQ
jgi:hypothetical protein